MIRSLSLYVVTYVLSINAQISCICSSSSLFSPPDSVLYTVAYNTAYASPYGTEESFEGRSLDETIIRGKKLGVLGTVVHFSGFILSAASMPYTVNQIRLRRTDPDIAFPGTGLALSISGFTLSVLGALPSCVGAGKIEEALEDANINFKRNRYWNFYARSLAYEAAGWGLYLLGTLLMKDIDGETVPIILMTGLFAIELGAESYRGIAAAGPIAYSKSAGKRLQRSRSFNIDFHPCVTLDGSVGCRGTVYF